MPTARVVHLLPGRSRFRIEGLPGDGVLARRLADELARLEGVHEVRVRPRTGSVLVLHDRDVGVDRLAPVLLATSGADHLVELDERPSAPAPTRDSGRAPGSSVGRATVRLVRDLDQGVVEATDGRLDLATLASWTCFALGAAEVFATRNVPVPPWFNLAWWGVRFFRSESQAVGAPDAAAAGGGPAH